MIRSARAAFPIARARSARRAAFARQQDARRAIAQHDGTAGLGQANDRPIAAFEADPARGHEPAHQALEEVLAAVGEHAQQRDAAATRAPRGVRGEHQEPRADHGEQPIWMAVVLAAMAVLGVVASIAAVNWMAEERSPYPARAKRNAGAAVIDCWCVGPCSRF